MNRSRILDRSIVLVGLSALALLGCGGGNAPSSGGATGGTDAGTGGVASGGRTGSGGAAGSHAGGSVGSGGNMGSGGMPGTGGRLSGGSGGTVAVGSGGPSSPGGQVGPGSGGAGTGAAAAGGNAGSAATGSGGTSVGGSSGGSPSGPGGSTASTDAPMPSAGCMATPTTTSCNTQSAPCKLDVNGTGRQYWAQLPDNYDPKHPYPVVFQYHPLGGNGWQGLTMYMVRPKFPAAIYVSPDGLKSGQYQGFPNTDGEDEALTRAMMAELEAEYCVDKARYYATGFSYGGSMSYTAACNMSDVFRAIGAMSGAPISGATCTSKKPTRPVAVWATHGDADTALPITLAQPLIDSLVKYNGCGMDTKPVDPSPCVEYQGCMPGYPVIWCVRPGDPHAIPGFAAAAIAKFFQQF